MARCEMYFEERYPNLALTLKLYCALLIIGWTSAVVVVSRYDILPNPSIESARAQEAEFAGRWYRSGSMVLWVSPLGELHMGQLNQNGELLRDEEGYMLEMLSYTKAMTRSR